MCWQWLSVPVIALCLVLVHWSARPNDMDMATQVRLCETELRNCAESFGHDTDTNWYANPHSVGRFTVLRVEAFYGAVCLYTYAGAFSNMGGLVYCRDGELPEELAGLGYKCHHLYGPWWEFSKKW
jgi:hypothetical protein